MVLLDTCALIWYTLDPDRLSPKAHQECARIPRKKAYISSISIWEIGVKIKNGKLDIGTDIGSYLKALQSVQSISIVPVDAMIWVKNLQLDWGHRDPADRTIVATAILKDVPIISSDKLIRDFYPQTIW